MNLIPSTPAPVPHHWCTWNRQNLHAALTLQDASALLDSEGARNARNSLTRQTLNTWLESLHPLARTDLLVVLDDGWDLPLSSNPADQKPWFGMLEPHPDRFPNPASGTYDPTASLASLVQLARSHNWRGLGAWVCVQEPPRTFPGGAFPAEREAHWVACAQRFQNAGATYWKCDWGSSSRDEEFRRMVSRVARQNAPDLWVEHTVCRWPLNDWQRSQRMHEDIFRSARNTLAYSDVFRTYDVLTPLSLPTTIERVARHLADAPIESPARGLLHCEDEAYLGAVLGCVLGIMRYPNPSPNLSHDASRPNPVFPQRFEAQRPIMAAQDEVARALRWGRIAPAWRAGTEATLLDPQTHQDSWHFEKMETTFSQVIGQTIYQQAPARVARGLPLPLVHGDSQLPYVLTSRHPNGACAVGTFGRVDATTGFSIPKAHVQLALAGAPGPLGIFGHFASLTLTADSLRPGATILAQDLLSNSAENITSSVSWQSNSLVLSGTLLDRLGSSHSTSGDRSEPALVLAWKPPA